MTRVLNLGEDGRILSAAIYHVDPPEGAIIVDDALIDEVKSKETKEERRITNYRYEDGALVYDPMPDEEKAATPSQLDIIEAQVTYTAMMTDTLLEV